MRRLIQNPDFNYVEFSSKRAKLSELLQEYDEDDSLAETICDLLSECADAVRLAAYMSPNYVEIIAKSLDSEIDDYETARNLAEFVCSRFIENYEEYEIDRVIAWTVGAMSEIYEASSDKNLLAKYLNKVVEFFNSKAGPDLSVDFTFPGEAFEKSEFKSSFFECLRDCAYESEDPLDFDLVRVKLECTFGFLSFIFAYLNSPHFDAPITFLNTCGMFYVKVDFERSSEDSPIPLLSDIIYETFPSIEEVTITPVWVYSILHKIYFFSVLLHFTQDLADSYISPESLRTRLTDYTKAPVVTHRRESIPSATRADNPRAIVYGWSEHLLRNLSFQKYRGQIETEFSSYGNDILFLFCTATVSFYKMFDCEMQSVSLLKDVVECIPCCIDNSFEYGNYTPKAFFGLNADHKTPLYYIDCEDWDRGASTFEIHALDNICEYLSSELYDPSSQINMTIRP